MRCPAVPCWLAAGFALEDTGLTKEGSDWSIASPSSQPVQQMPCKSKQRLLPLAGGCLLLPASLEQGLSAMFVVQFPLWGSEVANASNY